MGANSYGVAIGNEAVWNRLSDPDYDSVPRLLGMDLLRFVFVMWFQVLASLLRWDTGDEKNPDWHIL